MVDFFDLFEYPIIESYSHFHSVEQEEAIKLHVDLPGVKKEDIKIELVKNVLKIEGIRVVEGKHRTVRRFFELPKSCYEVNSSLIEATYDLGVLTITIPKLFPSKIVVK